MPSRNHFRLGQVLRLKRRQEEQQQLELKTLSEEEQRLLSQLDSLRTKEAQQLRSISDIRHDGALDPAELVTSIAYLDSVGEAISEQLGLVASLERQVLDSRDQLLSILTEKRSLETLERKQAEAAAREASRREAKTVDDIYGARFARRAKEA